MTRKMQGGNAFEIVYNAPGCDCSRGQPSHGPDPARCYSVLSERGLEQGYP